MTTRPSSDRTTAEDRSAPTRPRSSSVPTAESLRHAMADLREHTVLTVALLDVAFRAVREGDSERFAELHELVVEAARGARERARSLDDALYSQQRGIAGRA